MKIRIYVVDIEIPPKVKRWFFRLGIPAALLFGVVAIAYAAVPKTWTSGELLKADDLNSNFKAIDDRLNKPIVTKNGKQYSLGATYCGKTLATTGTFGYDGAKAQCENATGCASPSAHMCTSDELIRSMAVGIVPPSVGGGWYSAGVFSIIKSDGTAYEDECVNWTGNPGSAGAASYGLTWNFNSVWPGSVYDICTNAHPIFCCD